MDPERKAALLGIMTDELRSLFENTVEPLMVIGPCQDGLRKAQEDVASWEAFLAGGPAESWRREMLRARVEAALAKVAWFQARIESILARRRDVVLALAELEAPIVEEGGGAGGLQGRTGLEQFLVKKKKDPADPASITDPASIILDFVGGYSALCGIGAAASAMREGVTGWLPSLALGSFGSAGTTALLEKTCRSLQHLSLRVPPDEAMECAGKVKALALPQRLHSFRFCFHEGLSASAELEEAFTAALFSVEWPKLRALEVPHMRFFLKAVTFQAQLRFPRLQSLAAPRLSGADARALLALLDRGAFPSLKALTCTRMRDYGNAPNTGVGVGSVDDFQQQREVLTRLPDTDALRFTGVREHSWEREVNWGPLVQHLQAGHLTSLQRFTVHYTYCVSLNDHTSLFNAIGTGALPNLERLHLIGAPPSHPFPHNFVIPANCLPSLRALRLEASTMPTALIAALMAAAGQQLALITTRADPCVADAVVEHLAREDYPWLPSLVKLKLDWFTSQGWTPTNRPNLEAALARLPALKDLVLRGPTYDHLVIKLLKLLDTHSLPHLEAFMFYHTISGEVKLKGAISDEIRLLLGLWLKRQARAGRVFKCDIKELALSAGGERTWSGTKTDECLAQIEAARGSM